ncbi:MAG TPA: DEAD/DEAH box helicase, partial [Acidimicrobiales bacterium]|nr:DEAD/DEAH box helicase [Acidimicrobiales bacterium]
VAVKARGARPRRPRALILAPTRELAAQIHGEIVLLLGRRGRDRVAAFYGGVGFGAQLAALRRGVDVAVACPGRLEDLMQRGACDLSEVEVVVIDEADRMADMGFLPAVRRILDQVPADRQTLLFSATLDGEVDVLVRRYQRSPVRLEVEQADDGAPAAEHHWVPTPREERVQRAAGYVASHGSAIVFCRTKHGTDRLARQLAQAGVKAVPIHGGRSQSQRDRALAAFTAGRAQALVATDVAARGIHVDNVGCVVHFDLPATDKDYLHRSGRTGRAGAAGVVVSLVTPEDREAAGVLRRALGQGGAKVAPGQGGAKAAPGRRPGPARRDRKDRSNGRRRDRSAA